MDRKLIKKLLRPFIGKKYLQAFYEKLHILSLVGMNYGIGEDVKESGELIAIKYIYDKLQRGNNKFILFDVGANVGEFTKGLLREFSGADFQVYSFEPASKVYATLLKNINSPQVKAMNIGLSDKPGKLKLYSGGSDTGLTSVYQRDLEHINIRLDNFEEIELTTVDAFCKINNIESIDYLKMDVEGHEYKVLEGAQNMLKEKKIKFISFEFGGCNIDSRTYFKDFYNLLKDQYNLYRIVSNGLQPIREYNEIKLEIFITINFLAELKTINS